MALEKSLLDEEIIRDLLKKNYNIPVRSIKKLPFGTANCYKVESPDGTFFLKEFPSGFPEDALSREAELVNFLKVNRFPTAAILPTADGHSYFRHNGRLIYVQEFLGGQTYANDLPRRYLPDMAELLGQLHVLLRGYALPVEMDKPWLDGYSVEKTQEQYETLLTVLEDFRDDPYYENIREDLLWKREFARKNADLRPYYDGITYTPSHGDYTAMQLICGKTSVHVIDFSRAATLPAVWEIMRSYVQSFGLCKDEKPFDTEDFCGYVRRYLSKNPLTKTDLAAMPYVYLHQLARSKYGYKEYLVTQAEDREELLRFGMWRTEICREIDRKKDEISEKLVKLTEL